jgi:catecholate siderophore receptor
MTPQDFRIRSSLSHAALSAGLAFSFTSIGADDAAAQNARQQPAPQPAGSSVQLDTIDVTGQGHDSDYQATTASSPKQTAPLLDTPQTVTVIPQQIISEQGARSLTDVLRSTPGITFDGGENGFATSTNNFKLRGFDGSGNVFIDGARSSGSYARDIFNTERVEIFKGAAADNGRGGAGGYVNMVTKTPMLENFTSGALGLSFDGYGTEPVKRGTVDMNYIVTPNTAVRLNGVLEQGGVLGRNVAKNKVWGIAPSVAFGLGTDKRAIFAYEHVQRRDVPEWGIPAATLPGTFRFDPAFQGARRDAFYGLNSDFDHATSDMVMARFEYDISKYVTLSNQTKWTNVERTARYTIPFSVIAGTTNVQSQSQFYGRTNTALSNLTNLSAEFFTGPLNHKIALGFEVSREDSNADRRNGTNVTPADLFNPDPNRSPPIDFVPNQTNGVKVDTVAAYLYDTIKFNEQWQLTGGLRVERYDVSIASKTAAGLPVAGGFDGYSYGKTTLGGKVGLVYKPVDYGTFYVATGISHLPPGSYLSNPDISREADGSAFPGLVAGAEPVRLHHYEIGTKWDFLDKRLSATAALFRTIKKNVPFDYGGLQYGEQMVQGLELGLTGHLTNDWQIFAGLLFMNSERTHNAVVEAARPGTNGDELAFTPNVSGNLWTTYHIPHTNWTIGGGLQYVGSSWVGRPDDANAIVKNAAAGKLPSYFLVHGLVSYDVTKDVQIRFNVDNIFDEKYAVGLNWSAQRAALGAPRTFRISTNFKF